MDTRQRIQELKKEINTPHLTDTGNAEIMVKLFGERIRFDHKRGRWLVWDTHRWVDDNQKSIKNLAMEMAKIRQKDSITLSDSTEKLKAFKWGIESESRMRIDAMLDLAKSLNPISDSGENWDLDQWVLSCPNGIIDLKTGKLRNGKPEDKISMTTPVEYHSETKCPRWEQFLNEVFLGDKELINFIQKSLGYSITGSVRDQVAYFCYGTGANGKSVLFKTISSILGDYAHDAPTTLFQRSFTGASNDVAATEHKRFLVSSETLSTAKLNEQRLKAWTGGDRVTARYLYQEHFTFEPTVKPWLFVNHKPQIEDDSYGFWRRVRLIPFERTFKPEEQDHKLLETLKAESQGILNWLIQGCLKWQEEGLNPIPEKVMMATQTYQAENDVLAEFIYSKCTQVDGALTKARTLYQAYEEWAESERVTKDEKLTKNSFGRRMGEKFKSVRKEDGPYYLGVELADGIIHHFSKTPIREDTRDSLVKSPPITSFRHEITSGIHQEDDFLREKTVEEMSLDEVINIFQ